MPFNHGKEGANVRIRDFFTSRTPFYTNFHFPVLLLILHLGSPN